MAFSTLFRCGSGKSCNLIALRQCGQTLRIKRCAMIALIVAGSKNGWIPILMIRVSVSAAEFVWIVETTRCPVSDASIAMLIVSWSRISPTIIISGSWRRAVRSPLANEYPISGKTCDWLSPSIWFSTGSSSVMIFTSGLLRRERHE